MHLKFLHHVERETVLFYNVFQRYIEIEIEISRYQDIEKINIRLIQRSKFVSPHLRHLSEVLIGNLILLNMLLQKKKKETEKVTIW